MSAANLVKRVSLECRVHSNKDYVIELYEQSKAANDYIMRTLYGPAGHCTNAGVTKQGTYATVNRAFESLVKQKLNKFYEVVANIQGPVEPPAVISKPPKRKRKLSASTDIATHYKPAEYASVTAPELDALLDDQHFLMQPVMAGKRCFVAVDADTIGAADEQGKAVKLPATIVRQLNALTATHTSPTVLEGQFDGRSYCVHDARMIDGYSLADQSFRERVTGIGRLLRPLPNPEVEIEPVVTLAFTFSLPTGKRAALPQLQVQGAHGVLFKRSSARYVEGRSPAGDVAYFSFADQVLPPASAFACQL